ncbi:MAG: zf-TFIIB domain-containing protein [Gammaproteobacteria bacterium]|nr:zf-TFIIB domain-containing protein [Gammaproteobacteria bacterium]
MKCPKCQSEMEILSFAGTPVDRCTGCRGLWFQPDEFRSLRKDDWLAGHLDDNTKAPDKLNKMQEVYCPECNARMKHLTDETQPHILYEQCPKGCGVFFDAGEFKDLAQLTFWDRFKSRKIVDK